MPMVKANGNWQSRAITTDEFWRARAENVWVTSEADPDPDDGVELSRLIGFTFKSGATVSYRVKTGEADIWAEAV